MRCFIAIDIDDEIRAALGELQQELAGAADIGKSDVKWVRPEAMHLTLKFLGEIRDNEVVDVCKIAKNVAAQHSRFQLTVAEVGCFGGRSARVLWVGAGLDCPELSALQADIEDQLDEAGWARESRKFSGHLTLCRIRNTRAGVALAKMTEQYKDFDLGTMRCDAIRVYQSKLTPTGPIYTALGEYRLS